MTTFIVMATSVFSFDRPALTGPGQFPPRATIPSVDTQDEAMALVLQLAPIVSVPQNPAAATRKPIAEAAQITDPTTVAARGVRRRSSPELGLSASTFLKPSPSARRASSASACAIA